MFDNIPLIIFNQTIDFDVVDKYDSPYTVITTNHRSPRKKPKKLHGIFVVLFQLLMLN